MEFCKVLKVGLMALVPMWFANDAAAAVREYWIAAEKAVWNYAPSGRNLMMPEHGAARISHRSPAASADSSDVTGCAPSSRFDVVSTMPAPSSSPSIPSHQRLDALATNSGEKCGLDVWGAHLAYEKYRYLQYSDGSFTKPVPQPQWMGILGPQIQAVEGDTLKVHFLNRADKPLSIHPHGVRYDEANEGADMKLPGGLVQPGASYTYTWQVDGHAAPGPNDPSSIVWLYHSHVDPEVEVYDGLIGTLVVTKKGMERSPNDPRPKDVDVSFTALFMVFNENGRKVLPEEKPDTAPLSEEEEEEGHLKHSINGYLFGNLQGLEVKKGQRVRWHLVAMGTEVDLHTAHWHGQTVLEQGRRTDVVELLPASMKTADMVATTPGMWMFHCHVSDHSIAGMSTVWRVLP